MAKIHLDQYDNETIKLVANELTSKYGSYELAGKALLFNEGTPTITEIDEVALNLVKSKAIFEINQRAENARVRVMGNSGIGMVMIYMARNDEAERAILEENPDPADYPFLAVEVGYYGDTVKDVANVVLQAKAQWAAAALFLEQLRRSTQQQVKDATTVDQVNAILKNTVFKIPQG